MPKSSISFNKNRSYSHNYYYGYACLELAIIKIILFYLILLVYIV